MASDASAFAFSISSESSTVILGRDCEVSDYGRAPVGLFDAQLLLPEGMLNFVDYFSFWPQRK
jgi:hypothetical protein